MKQLNSHGGVLAFFLILIWLVFVFVGVAGYLLYRDKYLRIEFGEPPKEDEKKIIFDANTKKQLEKKIEELNKREQDLKRKEELLQAREEQLVLAKKNFEKLKANIDKNAAKIESMFRKFNSEEEANLKKLSQLYENMKANKVAIIFDKLDKNTVAELLKRMKKRASAKILAEIGQNNAARAAEISNIIQGKEKDEAFKKALEEA